MSLENNNLLNKIFGAEGSWRLRPIGRNLIYGGMFGVPAVLLGLKAFNHQNSMFGSIPERLHRVPSQSLSITKMSSEDTNYMDKKADATSGIVAPISAIGGYEVYKKMFPGISGMISYTKAPETIVSEISKSFGKEIGKGAAGHVQNMISNMMIRNNQIISGSPRRKLILDQLRKEDMVIAKAPMDRLLEAYHSMVQVAPTLSVDKNAVKSFLRTVATSPEGGIDWNTMKGLAEAEKSVRAVMPM